MTIVQQSGAHLTIRFDAELAEYLNRKDISLTELCLLKCIYHGGFPLLLSILRGKTEQQATAMIFPLVRKQLVTNTGETTYTITEYGMAVCEEVSAHITYIEPLTVESLTGTGGTHHSNQTAGFEELVDKYLECFPVGVKNGGHKPLRSNKTDVKAKMLKFINKYKFEHEIILKATANFIERLRGVYTYCPTAEYFILKDSSSALATECDMVKNGTSDEDILNPFIKRM